MREQKQPLICAVSETKTTQWTEVLQLQFALEIIPEVGMRVPG